MKKQFSRKVALWALAILVSVSSVGYITELSDNYFEISKNLDIFGKLYREVNSLYVDEIDPTDLMRTGIDKMLGSLDPYTNFISASEIEDYRFMSTGKYGGIGALIGRREGKMMILEPYEGYPADKAGLKAGDMIIQVDEEKVEGTEKDVTDVRNLLRGQENTEIRLKIQRPGEEKTLDVTLKREEIKIDNVPYFGQVNENVGYISLTGFTRDAGQEVRDALKSLKEENPNLKGVILDVRGNPGGLLHEAVNVANVFLPMSEKIVETKGKMEGSQKTYSTRLSPVDLEIPVVVLTNGRSASASEIVSGVIQDLDRGVIVGQKSFGKGLVQTTRPLSYNTQVKLTTAKYYTPSGRCIQAINYSERDDDGNIKRIPDSLKNTFKTRVGRPVYDGGGIDPDIEVDKPKYKPITRELDRQDLIFDYATKFVLEHEEILSPRDFKITNEIYSDFMAFVNSKDFSYDTKAEKQLEKLKEIIEEENYYDDIAEEYKALKTDLEHHKDNDLQRNRAEISKLLKEEIVLRYYYKSGLIEASFEDDDDLRAAIEVLEDQERYKQILSAK